MTEARTKWLAGIAIAAMLVAAQIGSLAQSSGPTNDLPNPYVGAVLQLPGGRTWGATAGVDIDKDGKSVWAIDRCGANSCVKSDLDPILKFDASGKLVKSFGKGMFAFPHGIHVDPEGNVWVTDMVLQDGRGQGASGIGQQVIKFSPDGKELMRLGKAGVSGTGTDVFSAPSDVVIGRNGDIFVADGHATGTNERMMKFDKTGKFIKQWGKPGFGKPGTHEFSSLHALAIDSRGRLFIGDRDNNRIQIYDQDGNFLDSWEQFSRPSGIHIDANDNMYVADSESSDAPNAGGPPHGAWKRGIRVGSARDGSVKYLIPDPAPKGGSSAAEGVAADRDGIIYGAEVGPRRVMRYVRK
jgi:DNA-binding beta-propeller fold protein YncE